MFKNLRIWLISVLAHGDTVIMNADLEMPEIDSVMEWIGPENITAIVQNNRFYCKSARATSAA